MSSNEIAIKIDGLGKRYEIYERPGDRLKQFIFPKLQSMLGIGPKQYFREFWALRDISIEVKKGETVGIIGRNGSGKSTLLQTICGTLTPTMGSVQTNGRIAALLELGSGFNPEFTGRDNVYLNASVLGLTKEETDARFDDIVSFADIGDFIDQPTKTYSSGMMVRLAFAVIAHVDADILVVDEALAVGDAFFTQKCMRFLRTFMKAGTILFVSHDTSSIRGLCSNAIWLDKGKLIKEGLPKEITEAYLQKFYEDQQGESDSTRNFQSNNNDFVTVNRAVERDYRIELFNASNLRNDLRIFEFKPDAESFGQGAASIAEVSIVGDGERALAWVIGGELIKLRILIEAHSLLISPIVGFLVKDRLGQDLFGDNTYISFKDKKIHCDEGDLLQVDFMFYMPILPVGDFSIAVAIAEGTQDDHVQHHWVHDALIFRSETSSKTTGLVGVPMHDISMNLIQRSQINEQN
jgi:lipopolysaccharide transport system ATP-binding protein